MKTWTPPTPAEVERTLQEMVRRIVVGFHPEKASCSDRARAATRDRTAT